uniref:Uncharacterized protein n=1 Tax=Arundo donax TaxID=35708 RepID=A0A0A8YKN6_ARUDO
MLIVGVFVCDSSAAAAVAVSSSTYSGLQQLPAQPNLQPNGCWPAL